MKQHATDQKTTHERAQHAARVTGSTPRKRPGSVAAGRALNPEARAAARRVSSSADGTRDNGVVSRQRVGQVTSAAVDRSSDT